MKKLILLLALMVSTQLIALSPWLENLDATDKQQQLDLRWKATGGQVNLKFMYTKLSDMNIQVSPKPEFPNKHWDYNNLVYPISKKTSLELQMPYGNIEKVTAGAVLVDSDFSLSYGKHSIKVNSFRLVPTEKPLNKGDIVTFKFIDQSNNHLFTIYSVHIEYDKDKGLLLMSNMDLFATSKLAQLLNNPHLENQVVGQIHTYSNLTIPENAKKSFSGITCASRPLWSPDAETDVALIDIGAVQWMRNIGTDKIVIAPSATLKNVGTADVPWHNKFTGPEPPYNNDQHPFLNWSVYREIDGRFEQLGYSGVKHAFLTININCTLNCSDMNILWLGCEDVYGVGTNDASSVLGPRAEIEANAGLWENCGSFFDPKPCTGSQQNNSNATDENRLVASKGDLVDVNNVAVYMQAWYMIRDDINIFNTMGYRQISPVDNGGSWNMNMGPVFKQGAALDNYITPNTITATQASSTVATGEGLFTVAVKVVNLGGGLYRYNYAVENYEFDPRFINYHIDFPTGALLTDTYFNDPEQDASNDWQFVHDNDVLSIAGNAQNEQDWGMLFSFSFTTDLVPTTGTITIDVAQPVINLTVSATVLVPDSINADIMFASGFE